MSAAYCWHFLISEWQESNFSACKWVRGESQWVGSTSSFRNSRPLGRICRFFVKPRFKCSMALRAENCRKRTYISQYSCIFLYTYICLYYILIYSFIFLLTCYSLIIKYECGFKHGRRIATCILAEEWTDCSASCVPWWRVGSRDLLPGHPSVLVRFTHCADRLQCTMCKYSVYSGCCRVLVAWQSDHCQSK